MKQTAFFFILLMGLTSCNQFIAEKLFGLEVLEVYDETRITTFYEDFNFEGLSFDKKEVETDYLEILGAEETLDSLEKKNLYQAIQFFVLDQEKILFARYACQARPKGKTLLWNLDGCMDKFPSSCTTEEQEDQYQFIQEHFMNAIPSKKYHLVYVWSNMLSNQSKQTLNLLLDKIDEAGLRADTHLSLVNMDKMFVELYQASK